MKTSKMNCNKKSDWHPAAGYELAKDYFEPRWKPDLCFHRWGRCFGPGWTGQREAPEWYNGADPTIKVCKLCGKHAIASKIKLTFPHGFKRIHYRWRRLNDAFFDRYALHKSRSRLSFWIQDLKECFRERFLTNTQNSDANS